jgi:presenilin-like A22 family membrane protease
MKKAHSLIYLLALYILIQALGLSVGVNMSAQIKEGVIQPAIPEGENPKTSVNIFAYVLVFTGILLILLKLGLDLIIKIFTYIALYVGVLITLTTLFDEKGFILSIIYYAGALYFKKNTALTNLTLALTTAGIGGFLGASLAAFTALLLLLILSAYDLIAVFGTKHMVTLAEKTKEKIPFMFLIPLEDRHMGLGTGDMTLPLVYTASVLKDYTLTHAAATGLGGLIGLTVLFAHATKKGRTTLPALPPIALGLFAGFTASIIAL